VLVTGFGPFLDVARNPSGDLALSLAQGPPEGIDVAGVVLPVSFTAAPAVLQTFLEGLWPRVPDVLLGLGLHREGWLRLEARARGSLGSAKRDVDGQLGSEHGPLPGGELRTSLDLGALAHALRAAGATDVRPSEDAGGYVCERAYHAALSAGERLGRPAVFLHVPPAEVLGVERQSEILRAWLPPLLAQAAGSARDPAGAPGLP
jgi:pyroglutamyl-peptidase